MSKANKIGEEDGEEGEADKGRSQREREEVTV